MAIKTACTYGVTLWFVSLLVMNADAQVADGFEPVSDAPVVDKATNGFHLIDATLSSGYSSSLGWLGSSWTPAVNSSIYYGEASLQFGYTHATPRGTLDVEYTPSYSALNGLGGLRFLNQKLSFGYRRRYGAKWAFRLSGQASDYTFEDFLFPGGASGYFSSLSSVAAGSTTPGVIVAPPQALLFGDRQFMYTATVGFEYKPSNRLSISVDTGTNQTEALNRNDYSLTPIVPWMRGESARVGLTYSRNTRTELQTVWLTSVTQSPFGDYLVSTISEGLVRKITQHWDVLLQGGGGIYRAYSGSERGTGLTSFLAGGGTRYSGRANTLDLTFNRTMGDSFGVASESAYGFQGIWKWQHPGSSWGLDANAMEQRLIGGYLGNFTLWQAGAGITRALSDTSWVRIEYAWLLDTAIPYGFRAKPQAHGVKLTFGWNAAAYGSRRTSGPVLGSPAFR